MKLNLFLLFFFSTVFSSLCDEPTKQAEPPQMTGATVDQQLFFCTTRIEAKSTDGKKSSVGTGFIVSQRISETLNVEFIVTCRHVIAGFDQATVLFVGEKDGKPLLGQACSVTITELSKYAFFNSDPTIDVAIFPLRPLVDKLKADGHTPFIRTISKDSVPSDAIANGLSTIQPVLFVGYPNGIRDDKNFLPLARRGFTSTPYTVDYSGLPLFLVDANVFPGSSGSPVLVFDQGSYPDKGGLVMGDRLFLLGLISQAYLRTEDGEVQFKAIPSAVQLTYKQTTFLNLGVVVKARAVFATIDQFLKAHPVEK